MGFPHSGGELPDRFSNRSTAHYFKALHRSYPSREDLRRSSALHSRAGGNIFIHSKRYRPTKPVSYYKTRVEANGCIAGVQDVWDLTAGPARVEIVP